MKTYDITRFNYEFKTTMHKGLNEDSFYPGMILDQELDNDDEVVETYNTLEEAREALKKYHSSWTYMPGHAGSYWIAEEYYIVEMDGDDFVEFLDRTELNL